MSVGSAGNGKGIVTGRHRSAGAVVKGIAPGGFVGARPGNRVGTSSQGG